MDEDKGIYLAVAIFLLVIGAVSYNIIKSGQEDTYTVLYFSNPVDPLIYDESQNTIKVNFLIENHEGEDFRYMYLVKLNDQEALRTEIIIKDEETISISEKILLDGPLNEIDVSVELHREGFEGPYRRIRSNHIVVA